MHYREHGRRWTEQEIYISDWLSHLPLSYLLCLYCGRGKEISCSEMHQSLRQLRYSYHFSIFLHNILMNHYCFTTHSLKLKNVVTVFSFWYFDRGINPILQYCLFFLDMLETNFVVLILWYAIIGVNPIRTYIGFHGLDCCPRSEWVCMYCTEIMIYQRDDSRLFFSRSPAK